MNQKCKNNSQITKAIRDIRNKITTIAEFMNSFAAVFAFYIPKFIQIADE